MKLYNFRMPVGLEDVSKYPDLFDRLYETREGEPSWTKEDLEKLAGRNFIRVFQAVEAASAANLQCIIYIAFEMR